MKSTTRTESAFWYGCTVLILLSAALYNGFPLFTSDTGAYINSGFQWEVPHDRPIVYGIFLRLTSLKFSLWLVVAAQCALLAALLLRSIRLLAPKVHAPGIQICLILLSGWATGMMWFSGQLMPDIFTAMGLLTMLLLYFDKGMARWQYGAMLLLLLLCTIIHSSNLLSYSLVAVLMLAYVRFVQRQSNALPWRNGLVVAAVVLSGWLVLPSLHWAFGGGFSVSRSSYMFLMGRLVETGVLDKYLARRCNETNGLELCKYRGELPNDAISFLWDGQSVPNRTGGWEAHRVEYSFIIRDILTSPRYYPMLVSEAAQATLRQLISVGHGDGLTAHRDNTNPFWKVQAFFPYELREYLSSRQNQSKLDFKDLSSRNELTLLITLAALCIGLGTRLRSHLSEQQRLWLLVCIVGIFANAGVTGGLANVLSRLQARVVWVLPFSLLCLLAAHSSSLIAYFSRFLRQSGDHSS